jgi:hypothetical protein
MGDSIKKYKEMVENGEIDPITKKKKILERNPDTGEIRSRKPGDYGNEKIEKAGKKTTLQFQWNWRSEMASLIRFLEMGDNDNRAFAKKRLMEIAEGLDKLYESKKN